MIVNERKSSHSNPTGCCVLAGELIFGERKASGSMWNGGCVEAGQTTLAKAVDGGLVSGDVLARLRERGAQDGDVLYTLRDDKLGDASPVLVFDRQEWEAFTRGVRDGEFDLDAQGRLPEPGATAV